MALPVIREKRVKKRLIEKWEIKLFLVFFCFFIFFSRFHWGNGYSHMDLTLSMVDRLSLNINPFYNNTSDRAYYKGNYYSTKEPGLSLVSSLIYSTLKFYFRFLDKGFLNTKSTKMAYRVGNDILYFEKNLKPFYLYFIPMLTFLTSSFFSSLSIVILYRILKNYCRRIKLVIFTLIIGIYATLLFPISCYYNFYSLANFTLLLAFYLLMKPRTSFFHKFSAFFLLGFSISTSTLYIPSALGIFFFNIFRSKMKIKRFFLLFSSFLLGLSPLLLYNYSIFGTIFESMNRYTDRKIYTHLYTPIKEPDPMIMIRLLFFPYRGLFYYYPILLLSLPGTFYLVRQRKGEAFLILYIFISNLLINSVWWDWTGGTSFGPRHLVVSVPFLLIPILVAINKNIRNKMFSFILFFLFFISTFSNLLSTHSWEWFYGEQETMDYKDEIKKSINSFQEFVFPIEDYYFPLFLKDFTRSRILESFFDTKPFVEIREPTIFRSDLRLYIGGIDISFLGLVSTIIFFFPLLWMLKECNAISTISIKRFFLLFLFLFFILVFTGTFVHYKSGWYTLEVDDEGYFRWMEKNSSISFYSIKPIKTLRFQFEGYKGIKSLEINGVRYEKESIKIKLQGIHTVNLFIDAEKCMSPSHLEKSTDARCLSFKMRKIEIEYD